MEYRINKRTGDKISIIGIGTSILPELSKNEAILTLQFAVENGINFFDLATSKSSCFSIFEEALKDVRKKLFYQIHFGTDYSSGEYGWAKFRNY